MIIDVTCPNFLLSFSARECLFTTEKQSRFRNTSSMLAGWLNRTTTYTEGFLVDDIDVCAAKGCHLDDEVSSLAALCDPVQTTRVVD